MKFYFDVTPYFWRTEDRGGIYHYIERFLIHLPFGWRRKFILFVRGRRVINDQKLACFQQDWKIKWCKIPGQLHRIFPLLVGRGKFLSFWDDLPLLFGLKPFVVIHDLRALFYEQTLKPLEESLPLYPFFSRLTEYKQRRRYFSDRAKALQRTLKRARGFIAISGFTASNLLKLGVQREKIKKIYHGPLPSAEEGALPPFLKGRDFLLYVGKVEPLKNIEGLLLAFGKLRCKFPEVFLVIAGPLTWYGRFLKANWPKLENVCFLDFVSPNTLEALYRKASCLVLPSFYEGFGLPVLEAMSRGLPVAASRAGAIPEIGGKACIYFDPKDSDEISRCLKELLQEPELRRKLAQWGKRRSRLFSWAKCVRETLAFIGAENLR